MDHKDPAPLPDTPNTVHTGSMRAQAIAWLIAAPALAAGAYWLADPDGTSIPVPLASASLTLAAVAALSWWWRREQDTRPSPWSEYVAVGYSAMFYIPALIRIADLGDRIVDWLIFIPPVSVVALLTRRLVVERTADPDRRRRRAQRVHRAASTVFGVAALFLMLTIIAIVVAPIPLVAAALHYHAVRFYRARTGATLSPS